MRPPQRMKARTTEESKRWKTSDNFFFGKRDRRGEEKLACASANAHIPIQPLLMGLFCASCFFTAVCGLPRLAASDLAKRSLARRCCGVWACGERKKVARLAYGSGVGVGEREELRIALWEAIEVGRCREDSGGGHGVCAHTIVFGGAAVAGVWCFWWRECGESAEVASRKLRGFGASFKVLGPVFVWRYYSEDISVVVCRGRARVVMVAE